MKEQLGQWKKEKEETKLRELEDKKRREEQAKALLRGKVEEERKWKREQVEDFKFRREMERQKELQVIDMEKRKQAVNQEQRERIIKREEEVFMKKQMLILEKQQEREELAQRKEQALERASKGVKAESRLNQETKAARDKKREKFDEARDGRKDAMTMGGNLLGVSVRALPLWRQGI